MDLIIRFDLNIFAIILLIALLIVIYSKNPIRNVRNQLFKSIVFMTILMLIFEIFSWVFDGIDDKFSYYMNWFSNFCFTAFSIIVVSLWTSYIDYHVFNSLERLKKKYFYMIPAVLMIILSIINFFSPFLFVVSQNNIYSRLTYVWISMTIAMIMYLYVIILVVRMRKEITDKVIYGVIVFLSLPIIGGVLQLLFFGLLLIWPSTAVALVFSYIIFETTSSSKDFLTGANTRKHAENVINNFLDKRKAFTVIMMDVDDFKVLNDTYGHTIGDSVLIETAKILKQAFGKKAVVSRFGGDEFLVVYEGVNQGDVHFINKEVKRLVKNSKNDYMKHFNVSMGFDFCSDTTTCTIDEVITAADNDMYLNKAKNKNLKRRKSDR